MFKTNVMRLLDAAKISYTPHEYDEGVTDGVTVAQLVGLPADQVFKTLVTVANTREYFVFVIPVAASLDLKKAAKSVGVKSIEMIKQKELLPLTGYIHGGCSPIGMKKKFTTVFHETFAEQELVAFSAGKVGYQVETSPGAILDYVCGALADVTE